MGRFTKYRPSPAMVVAFIALSAALTGSATALTGSRTVQADDLATGSVGKRAIRTNGVGKAEIRSNAIGRSELRDGAVTPPKISGTVPVANGLDKWGVVNSNGAFERGAGVTSTTRTGTGAYHVVFDEEVDDCGYLATLGRVGPQLAQAGEIGTGSLPGNANGVWVRTRDSAGNLSNRSFHIAVTC
jgi:hypothetical protein